jgi:hypothetical protein
MSYFASSLREQLDIEFPISAIGDVSLVRGQYGVVMDFKVTEPTLKSDEVRYPSDISLSSPFSK